MLQLQIQILTDGSKLSVMDFNGKILVEEGSLRDGTEALEHMVLKAQYYNAIGNFTSDRTISAMVTNPDLRAKMQAIIDKEKDSITE